MRRRKGSIAILFPLMLALGMFSLYGIRLTAGRENTMSWAEMARPVLSSVHGEPDIVTAEDLLVASFLVGGETEKTVGLGFDDYRSVRETASDMKFMMEGFAQGKHLVEVDRSLGGIFFPVISVPVSFLVPHLGRQIRNGTIIFSVSAVLGGEQECKDAWNVTKNLVLKGMGGLKEGYLW